MSANIPLVGGQLGQDHSPVLENKASEPKGVIRRNLKMQVYLGVAALFVVATMVSSLRHKPLAKPVQQAPDPMVQQSAANVEEMKRELEKVQHDATAVPMRNTAGSPNPPYSSVGQADPSSQFGAATMPSGYNCVAGQPCPPSSTGYANYQRELSPEQQARMQFEQQERELAYKARFASNLAYSQSRGISGPSSLIGMNQAPPGTSDASLAGTQGAPVAASLYMSPNPSAQLPSAARAQQPSSSLMQANPPSQTANRESADTANKHPAEVNVNSAIGQPYVVYEGTLIETALMNRLDGDASGPVKVLVTNPVYSHDHQHVLIPDGTVVLGESRKIGAAGFGQQRRLAVVFHRMIMPDGYSVDLDQFQGLNQIGETGLKDKVNNHYIQIFGTSIALGIIAGAAQISTPGGVLTGNGTDAFKYGAASSVSQSATTILDRFINIPPTITIREGHRVKVYISQDLLLPAYENHTIPSMF